MRVEIVLMLALAVVSAYATSDVAPAENERSFITSLSFTTFTLIKSTTTTTSTFTSVTTCTTSTAALTTCTIGRRRRGLFYDDAEKQGRARRGLFYDEDETENKDGSVFLPEADNKESDPAQEAPAKAVAEDAVVPLEVQSGFALPESSSNNRFLLAFGTSTITSLVVTTSTRTLTAICSSTSGFSLCGTGK